MDNHIAVQALRLGVSLALGMTGAFLYDLFRAARLRSRRSHPLTHLLDGVYVLCLAFFLLWLAVDVGQGILRLYMLLGCGAGGLLWWIFPARLLRPVWDFWLDALTLYVHWLILPAKQLKKLFYFFSTWSIMKKILGRRRHDGAQQPESHEETTP